MPFDDSSSCSNSAAPAPFLLHEHLARGPGRVSVAGHGSWLNVTAVARSLEEFY